MNIFERQKNQLFIFVDAFRDRCDLLIKDGINIVFDVDSIIFENLITLRYNIKKVYPEVIFNDAVDTPDKIKVVRNIFNNMDELHSLIKEYTTLYTHMKRFVDKGESKDNVYSAIMDGIEDIVRNNASALEGKCFLIDTIFDEHDKISKLLYLRIDAFGNSKKVHADISYIMTHNEMPNDTKIIYQYQINKNDMASDIAFQISNGKLSHLPDDTERQ